MHSATVFFALACVASTYAIGIGHDLHAHPAYKFSYAVADKHTGDQKSAAEVRDGGVTKGQYSLVQPDGVVRTVKYIVTPHGGFQAQVLNNGVAAHPAVLGKGVGLGLGAVSGAGLGWGGVSGAGLGLGAGQLGLGLGGGASSVVGVAGSPVSGGLGWGLGNGLGLGLGNAGLGLGLGLL